MFSDLSAKASSRAKWCRTTVSDIAATISMIVGCALPDAAVGDPVPEVLR
ncbi:MAG: hypothetical protein IPF64_18055 [Flavobacteriales bacterium]|nr:hypothetical protein [Flavobacteriales bacterium]